jgi:hypothetical protein
MTQEQCLSLPSHRAHDAVCHPGSNANIQLQGITMGGTTPTSAPEVPVPEPSTFALPIGALLILSGFRARPRTHQGARREITM